MPVMNALVESVLFVFNSIISIYSFIIIAAALISWVSPDPYNPIVRILRNLTEPVLWRVRKLLPFTYKSGMDFSPVVLLVGLHTLRIFINKLFY
jgi:YGGT family.